MRKWTLALASIVVLASLAPGVRAGKPGGGGPPPDPAIVCVKNVTAGSTTAPDVIVMNEDGSNRTVVFDPGASGPGGAAVPGWSPDGTQLVFRSNAQGEGIYVVNLDGSGLRKVVAANMPWAPRWSPVAAPDGNARIAFSGRVGDQYDVFVVNLDGTGLLNLTNTPAASEAHLTWSRDATRIAVEVLAPGDDVILELGVVDGALAVVGTTNLTAQVGFQVTDPSWARTGDRLAVAAIDPVNGGHYDIWLIDLADPSNPDNLTNDPSVEHLFPTWSPDDSKLAFMSGSNLYTIRADGSALTEIARGSRKGGSFLAPDWRR